MSKQNYWQHVYTTPNAYNVFAQNQLECLSSHAFIHLKRMCEPIREYVLRGNYSL